MPSVHLRSSERAADRGEYRQAAGVVTARVAYI
jgi:hypothetical protein